MTIPTGRVHDVLGLHVLSIARLCHKLGSMLDPTPCLSVARSCTCGVLTMTVNVLVCRANFVRAYDGHVSIQNKFTKAWTDVKCDLQVPGLLLLRDTNGEVRSTSNLCCRHCASRLTTACRHAHCPAHIGMPSSEGGWGCKPVAHQQQAILQQPPHQAKPE